MINTDIPNQDKASGMLKVRSYQSLIKQVRGPALCKLRGPRLTSAEGPNQEPVLLSSRSRTPVTDTTSARTSRRPAPSGPSPT